MKIKYCKKFVLLLVFGLSISISSYAQSVFRNLDIENQFQAMDNFSKTD